MIANASRPDVGHLLAARFDRSGHRALVQVQDVDRGQDDSGVAMTAATVYFSKVPTSTRNSLTKLLRPGSDSELRPAMGTDRPARGDPVDASVVSDESRSAPMSSKKPAIRNKAPVEAVVQHVERRT